MRELFAPNFNTRSTTHDSLGCSCCDCLGTYKPGVDENGYTHLLPNSQQLRFCDAALASVGKESVSLCFMKKTDHREGQGSSSTG